FWVMMETIMKIRIAILAACAGTLVLAQPAQTGSVFVGSANGGVWKQQKAGPAPANRRARGFKIGENESPRPTDRGKKSGGSLGFEKTFLGGDASFGRTLRPRNGGVTNSVLRPGNQVDH